MVVVLKTNLNKLLNFLGLQVGWEGTLKRTTRPCTAFLAHAFRVIKVLLGAPFSVGGKKPAFSGFKVVLGAPGSSWAVKKRKPPRPRGGVAGPTSWPSLFSPRASGLLGRAPAPVPMTPGAQSIGRG